jgi:hypothetical protein
LGGGPRRGCTVSPRKRQNPDFTARFVPYCELERVDEELAEELESVSALS